MQLMPEERWRTPPLQAGICVCLILALPGCTTPHPSTSPISSGVPSSPAPPLVTGTTRAPQANGTRFVGIWKGDEGSLQFYHDGSAASFDVGQDPTKPDLARTFEWHLDGDHILFTDDKVGAKVARDAGKKPLLMRLRYSISDDGKILTLQQENGHIFGIYQFLQKNPDF